MHTTHPRRDYIGKCGTAALCGTPHDLDALADRIRRLAPDRRDPERFHMEKSEIAAELRRLARELAA